jgi:hypothetical protein
MLVVGSSLIVYSGFRFAQMAARRGIPIAAGKLRASVFVPALGEPSTGQAAFSSDANVHAAAWRPARLKIAENRLKFREELQQVSPKSNYESGRIQKANHINVVCKMYCESSLSQF